MIKEFTATVYIIEEQKVLLIYHHKLQKWLPPGGHVEENETPPDAARREALEETGLTIELIPQENIWVNRWNANSFERPYLCLLEEIPPYKDNPAHQHMDFVYLGRSLDTSPLFSTPDLRWFTLDELAFLKPDEEIFCETLEVIHHLFNDLVPCLSTKP